MEKNNKENYFINKYINLTIGNIPAKAAAPTAFTEFTRNPFFTRNNDIPGKQDI